MKEMKKDYRKPAMENVGILPRTALLSISGGEAVRTGYGVSEKQDWDDDDVESNKANIWNDEGE